ncbi:hypothetical protein I552_4062 [Mycobacterium xenopi 3993]|nr:hypothetical protein I552_4062 [Mycobacterium xenopi 3993]
MTIRTTHFTGTMTDLGFMLGRSRRHGLDTWKATVLVTTVVLFLGGGAPGGDRRPNRRPRPDIAGDRLPHGGGCQSAACPST